MNRIVPVFLALSGATVCTASAQSRAEITDQLDLLAIAVFDDIQLRSIAENVEYCGVLGYDYYDNLVATEPVRGSVDGCNPGADPRGFDALASYHTHGAFSPDADTEVPSIEDLESDFREGIDGYVATPAGRVWLNLVEEQISVLLCGPGCVPSDPAFVPCSALPPGDTHTFETLADREARDTGVC